jgi:hypothetical protein
MNLCGRPSQLHDAARDAANLEERLLALYGVGPVTMNIFLRELRLFWTKANPDPLPVVERLAKHLSIDLDRYSRKSVVFTRVEPALFDGAASLRQPRRPSGEAGACRSHKKHCSLDHR